jgi:NADH-quinone oxidoreductase subunit J
MDWLAEHWLEAASLVLIAAGIWWSMPPARSPSKIGGLLLALLGIGLLAVRLHVATAPLLETVLFFVFSAGAILTAILMITNHNPVYSALWFALATLSVCGLFVLQFAPFLAAATMIVYAGAIVVTFVFVIMLAQQSGAAVYDQRSRQPLVATVAGFVVLGALLTTFHVEGSDSEADGAMSRRQLSASESPPTRVASSAPQAPGLGMRADTATAAREPTVNPLSQPAAGESLASMQGLGRSLFGDYLYAVELAGTLLLIATIGAIAIAPRRRRGTL